MDVPDTVGKLPGCVEDVATAVVVVAGIEAEADQLGVGHFHQAGDLGGRFDRCAGVMVEDDAHAAGIASEAGRGGQGGGGLLPLLITPAVAAIFGDRTGDFKTFRRRVGGDDEFLDAENAQERADAHNNAVNGAESGRMLKRQGDVGGGQFEVAAGQFGAQKSGVERVVADGSEFGAGVPGSGDLVHDLTIIGMGPVLRLGGADTPTHGRVADSDVEHS